MSHKQAFNQYRMLEATLKQKEAHTKEVEANLLRKKMEEVERRLQPHLSRHDQNFLLPSLDHVQPKMPHIPTNHSSLSNYRSKSEASLNVLHRNLYNNETSAELHGIPVANKSKRMQDVARMIFGDDILRRGPKQLPKKWRPSEEFSEIPKLKANPKTVLQRSASQKKVARKRTEPRKRRNSTGTILLPSLSASPVTKYTRPERKAQSSLGFAPMPARHRKPKHLRLPVSLTNKVFEKEKLDPSDILCRIKNMHDSSLGDIAHRIIIFTAMRAFVRRYRARKRAPFLAAYVRVMQSHRTRMLRFYMERLDRIVQWNRDLREKILFLMRVYDVFLKKRVFKSFRHLITCKSQRFQLLDAFLTIRNRKIERRGFVMWRAAYKYRLRTYNLEEQFKHRRRLVYGFECVRYWKHIHLLKSYFEFFEQRLNTAHILREDEMPKGLRPIMPVAIIGDGLEDAIEEINPLFRVSQVFLDDMLVHIQSLYKLWLGTVDLLRKNHVSNVKKLPGVLKNWKRETEEIDEFKQFKDVFDRIVMQNFFRIWATYTDMKRKNDPKIRKRQVQIKAVRDIVDEQKQMALTYANQLTDLTAKTVNTLQRVAHGINDTKREIKEKNLDEIPITDEEIMDLERKMRAQQVQMAQSITTSARTGRMSAKMSSRLLMSTL
ncbi:hypothetical protein PCE1_000509 [Barthelona sp. PCE]